MQESLNAPNYTANFAVDSSGTNSIVIFAENDSERFVVMPCDENHHMGCKRRMWVRKELRSFP